MSPPTFLLRRAFYVGAVVIGAIALAFGLAFLVRGLTFHTLDRGPGTAYDPIRHVHHSTNSTDTYYGAELHVDSTGATRRVDNDDGGGAEALYKIVEAGGGRVAVQHILVDKADESMYGFTYDGTSHQFEAGRGTELRAATIALPIGGVLLLVGIGGLLLVRSIRRNAAAPGF